MTEHLVQEAAAEKAAAVKQAEAEAAAKLAQVRIELAAVQEKAVAQAIAETEQKAAAQLEAEHQAEKAKTAEKVASLNRAFKTLMMRLVEQPEKAASKPDGPLAIMA